MRWVVVVLALSGCSSILGIEDFKIDGGGGGDGGEPFCLGPTGWQICLAEEPKNDEAIGNDTTINTNTSSKCLPTQPKSWKDAGQPDACIIIAKDININALLHANNTLRSRPLVLLAAHDITLAASIDVASKSNGTSVLIGAGADPAKCMNPDPPPTSNGPGGGAGGSFMQKGGNGGAGTTGAGSLAKDAAATRPVTLRGGCAGARGGSSGVQGGAAGEGGGAIYLVAGNRITIGTQSINASGSLGAGALPGAAGGGGGGSGGMIVLHAQTITGAGAVMANGGGGAGGAGSSSGIQMDGGEPSTTTPTAPASGGTGTGAGGRGGAGFAGMTAAVSGTMASVGGPAGGGGGGGGGPGYIMASSTLSTASPPVQSF
jgi:hypothetical protein